MSDLVFDVFFDLFAVFLARIILVFCSTLLNHAAGRPVKTSRPKNDRISSIPQGRKMLEKNKNENKICLSSSASASKPHGLLTPLEPQSCLGTKLLEI